MELLEIDHTPIKTIVERDLDPYIASSTPQDRALREMRMLLYGPPDSAIQTKWIDLHGNIIEITLTRNGSKNRAALSSPKHGWFEYKELPAQVSYMALNDFGDEKILRDFEAKLGEAQRAKAWVLDLRQNGGGSTFGRLQHLGSLFESARSVEHLANTSVQSDISGLGKATNMVRWHPQHDRAVCRFALLGPRLCPHQSLHLQRGRRFFYSDST